MKPKHIGLITILAGILLTITVLLAGAINQSQCQSHNSTLAETKDLPEQFYIENVPFYDYTMSDTSCMPVSLGMVMRFYDNKTTPDELNKQFPDLGWSLDNFKQYAKSQGYKIEDYQSSIEDLKLKISEGKPVIVSQWVDTYHKWGMYGHVRVVVGYTDKYFITFDPVPEKGKNYNITFSDFEKLWNRMYEGGCNRAFLVYK